MREKKKTKIWKMMMIYQGMKTKINKKQRKKPNLLNSKGQLKKVIKKKKDIKIEIFVPTKPPKKKKKAKKVAQPKDETPKDINYLLDVLFAFVGVSSKGDNNEAQDHVVVATLQLLRESCNHSRLSAGTITTMPGTTNYHQ